MYRYMNTSHSHKNGKGADVRPARRPSAGEQSNGTVYNLDLQFWFSHLAGSTGKVAATPIQLEPKTTQKVERKAA
jgi:hypothetical protein